MLLLTSSKNNSPSKLCYLGAYVIKKDEATGKSIYKNADMEYYESQDNYSLFFGEEQVAINNLIRPAIGMRKTASLHEYIKDKNYAYCFNCKKKVLLKVCSTYQFNVYDNEYNSYECPHCGTNDTICHMRRTNNQYKIYLKHFLNGNKLRIKSKYITYKFYKNNFFMESVSDLITLNLDTGMAYKFPSIINGKKNKKQKSIINVTYSETCESILSYSNYGPNTTNNKKDLIDIYNTIRDYKIKKTGVYIPTFEQQAKEAFSLDPKTSPNSVFDNLYSSCFRMISLDDATDFQKSIHNQSLNLSMIFIFNRFPYINLYKANNILSGGITKYGSNKETKKFIRSIEPNCTAPIAKLANLQNVPYSKKNRKFFNKKAINILTFKKLSNHGLKIDSIGKILEIIESQNVSVLNQHLFIDFLNDQKRNEDFIENNFVNKLCKELNLEKHNNYYLEDYIMTLKNIIVIDPNYKLNFRNYSIRQMHDIASSDYNKLRRENVEIPYEKKDHKLNKTIGDYTFTLAKDTHTLIDVGTKMHICVGGYDRSALSKDCIIVICSKIGSKDDYEVCIELDSSYVIKQAKRYRNRNIERGTEIEKALMEWISSNRLCIATYDIDDITIAQYYVNNPKIHEKLNKSSYMYKSLEEYNRILKEAQKKTFLDSEAEVI